LRRGESLYSSLLFRQHALPLVRPKAGILTMRISCNWPLHNRLHEKENDDVRSSAAWNPGTPGTHGPVAPLAARTMRAQASASESAS
jgi:hypothetical protein